VRISFRNTGLVIASLVVTLAALSASFSSSAMAGTESAIATDPTAVTLRYIAPVRDGAIELVLERQGSLLVLLDAGVVVASAPITAISAVSIGGPDHVDTALTIDLSLGAIAVPVDYHPGELGPRTDNTLNLRGAGASGQTHTVTGPHSGIILVDGTPIAYSNLTPINDTAPAANFTFNAGAGASTINVVNGPIVGGFQTVQINDGGTSQFETLNFANKTNVTINGASGGSNITVNFSIAATGMAKLYLNGSGGVGQFNIAPSQTIPITLTGNQTLPPVAASDSVNINVTGVTNLVVVSASNTFGVAGNYTFGNRAEVDFRNLAAISPVQPAAPVCTPTVPVLSAQLLVALGILVALLALGQIALRRRA
jgi:hypothetical protein